MKSKVAEAFLCIKSTWVCSILKGNEKEEEAAQEKRESSQEGAA